LTYRHTWSHHCQLLYCSG